MTYIYTGFIALVIMLAANMLYMLLAKKQGKVIVSVSTLVSVVMVSFINMAWSGFVSNFYWGSSNLKESNYFDVTARLICRSGISFDGGCILEKTINGFTLTVRRGNSLSDEEKETIESQARDVQILYSTLLEHALKDSSDIPVSISVVFD